MTRSGQDRVGDWRLKLYVTGGAVTLSRALPVLQTLGAEVLDERPFEVRAVGRQAVPDLRFRAVASRARPPPVAPTTGELRDPVLRGVHRRLVRPQPRSTGSTSWCWPPG